MQGCRALTILTLLFAVGFYMVPEALAVPTEDEPERCPQVVMLKSSKGWLLLHRDFDRLVTAPEECAWSGETEEYSVQLAMKEFCSSAEEDPILYTPCWWVDVWSEKSGETVGEYWGSRSGMPYGTFNIRQAPDWEYYPNPFLGSAVQVEQRSVVLDLLVEKYKTDVEEKTGYAGDGFYLEGRVRQGHSFDTEQYGSQHAERFVKPGVTAVYRIKIENDGDTADTFGLQADVQYGVYPERDPHEPWKVDFWTDTVAAGEGIMDIYNRSLSGITEEQWTPQSSGDITEQMRGVDGYTTRELGPGAAQYIIVTMTPPTEGLPPRTSQLVAIKASVYQWDGIPDDSLLLETTLSELVVNLDSDEPDADLSDGTNDVDLSKAGVQGTLRAAIQQANANQGRETIVFELPGSAVITPLSPLPAITDKLVIDAGTQPGSGHVELNGKQAGANASGLKVEADFVELMGLTITEFGGNAGVEASGAVKLVDSKVSGNSGAGVYALGLVDSWGDGDKGVVMEGEVEVSDNGNTGIGTEGPVDASKAVIQVIGNDGHGIWAKGDVKINLAGWGSEFANSPLYGKVSSVSGNAWEGILAENPNGSFANVQAGFLEVKDNGAGGPSGENSGIYADGTVRLQDSKVSGNNGPGIYALGLEASRIEVTDNANKGIHVEGDAEISTGKVCNNKQGNISVSGESNLTDVDFCQGGAGGALDSGESPAGELPTEADIGTVGIIAAGTAAVLIAAVFFIRFFWKPAL